MLDNKQQYDVTCPDCDGPADARDAALSRREFLRTVGVTVGGAAAASAFAGILPAAAQTTAKPVRSETLVKTFYHSLTPKQKELICMGWGDPLRSKVGANWAIVKQNISQLFAADQQEMLHGILRGLTTEEWYPKVIDQMKNDAGGFENYYVAMFGDPDQAKFEWVITGRHCTLRADGHSNANAAFGGPIFYGHAIKDTEDAGHPGNIYWRQGRRANEVFQSLDGKERSIALIDKAPAENKINLQGPDGQFPGIAIGELSADKKELVRAVMHDLLSPYRASDAKEVMAEIDANGGLDKVHLSFYKQDALGHDGTWDIWRLEGPSLVWHFRGAPHVHTWVNVAKDPKASDGHA
jgi:hypothetical protein